MKILFVNTWMHQKNMHSFMNYKNIQLTIVNNISDINNYDLSTFDCVYSPTDPIDISKYPGICFLFGPHFSVFPDDKIKNIQSNNSSYLMPSKWCIDFWNNYSICKNLNMVSCPFGVDTDRFCEIKTSSERHLVFIYYKSRQPRELEFIENLLKNNNIPYRIFSYRHRYNEEEYLEYLQNSKFGIWVDAHESQGFALEEALSCNVPLLVWNIRSMNQEYGQNYPDIPATTIPYWDERCGEYFYDMSDFKEKCQLFFSKIESYRPRDYVLENLSMSVCEKKIMDLIMDLKNNK